MLGKVATRKNLKESWQDISRFAWESSHGMSDETIQEFRLQADQQLEIIRRQLKDGNYKFGKLRATTKKKKSGKRRPLRIADIRDRVVQRALTKILEKYLSDVFIINNRASFAYQKKKGVQPAIKQMLNYHQDSCNIVLEADIENFFDTVNVNNLLNKMIFPNLKDNSINQLIKEAFEMEIGNRDQLSAEDKKLFTGSSVGLPQGGYLSPLFSNIYLSEFDQRMLKARFSLIRYADDFIVMCKTLDEAEKAYELAKTVLEGELGLTIHIRNDNDPKAKTRVVNLGKQKIKFLGIQFDGRRISPDPEKRLEFSNKLSIIRNESRNVMELLISTRNLLEGWVAAYGFTDLNQKYVNKIDDEINKNLWQTLNDFDWKLKPRLALTKSQRQNSGVNPLQWYLDKIRSGFDAKDRELFAKYWN